MTKLYVIKPLDGFVGRHPSVRLDLFVDDGHLSTTGPEEAVLETLPEAAVDFNNVIEKEFRCKFSLGKGGVSASSASLADRIARRLDFLTSVWRVRLQQARLYKASQANTQWRAV